MEKTIVKAIINTIKKEFSGTKIDLVHCHMTYPDGIVSIKIKKMYNIPIIISARSSDLDLSIVDKKKKRWMENIYEQADKIVTPSTQLKNKFKRYFNLDSEYIGNGIYPTELNIMPNKMLESQYKDKFMMLSISSLISRKRIEDNIKAVSLIKDKVPNLLYVVIGDGPEKNELIQLVDELNLQNKVIFLGQLDHKEAMSYIKVCDVFSLPSIRETFGLVYLEALFYNKPIILCKGEALSESLINNEDAILVSKFDYNNIANYIKQLYQDEEYYGKIANNGNRFVKNNYTWKIIGEKINKQYMKVIKNAK